MEYGLSLGSNMGDRLHFLRRARDLISTISGVLQIESSPVYETAPVGVRSEYKDMEYLNAVLILDAESLPEDISKAIHAIEDTLGRVRTDDRFAPRPIDIDILYAGKTLSESEDLMLPHPRWAERRFVVQPLADLRPDLIFPGDHSTVKSVLKTLPIEPAVRCYADDW